MPSAPLVDGHCHFDFPDFDGIRQQEWVSAQSGGVRGLVIPGVRRADWQRVQSFADPDKGFWYCLGIHPWFVSEHKSSDLQVLEQMLAPMPSGCLALGECGLDAVQGDISGQEPLFRGQIQLAGRYNLPLVVHSVKSHDEVHAILKSENWQGRALIHGFSGSYQQATKLVDLGCFIGVGGVITHERARKTRDTIARLPTGALVLETDAPDMAPAGVEKGRNSPALLPQIFRTLAELKSQHQETLARQLLDNVATLYGVAPEILAPAV